MSPRFRGTVQGHNVLLDADESMIVIDRIRLFVDGELTDERKSIGGTMSMHANVGGDSAPWVVEVEAGTFSTVNSVIVKADGEQVSLDKDPE